MKEYFKGEIDNRKFPIKCPGAECKDEIVVEDLNEVMSKEYIDKFWEYTFSNYVDKNTEEVNFFIREYFFYKN